FDFQFSVLSSQFLCRAPEAQRLRDCERPRDRSFLPLCAPPDFDRRDPLAPRFVPDPELLRSDACPAGITLFTVFIAPPTVEPTHSAPFSSSSPAVSVTPAGCSCNSFAAFLFTAPSA